MHVSQSNPEYMKRLNEYFATTKDPSLIGGILSPLIGNALCLPLGKNGNFIRGNRSI